MKAVVLAVVSITMLFYPLAVYLGLKHWGPASLAVLLAALVLARAVFLRNLSAQSFLFPALVLVYCSLVALFDSVTLLKYYPVLMSCAVASVFLLSLQGREPLLEKLAKMSGKTISPKAKVYLRKLTLIWSLVILANAAVAVFSACCGSMAFWGFYNGLVSYGIFALLFVGEWCFRQYYIRRYDS